MSPDKAIETALAAFELANAALNAADQERLGRRLEDVIASKRRVRERAQMALDARRRKK